MKENLEALEEIISCDIDRLLDSFDLQLKKSGYNYNGECPFHDSNSHAFNIFFRDGRYFYRCFSGGCHNIFRPSVIGLARGLLSKKWENWQSKGDVQHNFGKTVKFLKELYGVQKGQLYISEEVLERKQFVREQIKQSSERKPLCKREQFLSRLMFPSKYYSSRGFTNETLTRYMVGDCWTKGKMFCGRALVPVFDDDGKSIIGISGRSINDWEPKWLHSDGFPSGELLYNYWFAKEHIKKSKTAVIVESPGNVWRLEEAGIHNAVGVFGGNLSMQKQLKLDAMGVTNLILLMDNDDAGKQHAKRIMEECSLSYNIKEIRLDKYDFNDVGEMSVNKIKEMFNGSV